MGTLNPAANHFFPDQHPKVWWPIDDMQINRVDIFKYVSREKCEGKNVCVSSVLYIKESIGVSSMLLRVLAQIFKNPMNLLIWLFNFCMYCFKS